jgi:hypothetical protein
MYTKWMFHTADRPGICLASPGAIPIEMTHFLAARAVLVDVEIALRARSRVRATTRVDREFVLGGNLVILNV